ncbi:hypothetical protein J4402_02485 [Candidatus Pacearchaeota archaeon]|nr:hypothetical protein [Candidatus Pacearchaeota archaeon]
MKKEILTNKSRFGLYNLALERIDECQTSTGGIASFPDVFEKICRSFSIKKKEAWELLFMLRDFGMIEIVPFKGVIVK